MIYGIVNTKGGVGKTTIAVHLASRLSQQFDTLLIDGDEQASASAWAAKRNGPFRAEDRLSIIRLSNRAIYTEGIKLIPKFEHIVIDVGGQHSTSLRTTLMFAQIAVIPITVSCVDSWALTDILEIIAEAKDYHPDLQIRAVLSRVDARHRDTQTMIDFLFEQGVRLLHSQLSERIAYRRSVGSGMTVIDAGQTDKAAHAEVCAFADELVASHHA